MAQEAAFATGVPTDIYAFHRYTSHSTSLYHPQENQYEKHCMGLSPSLSLLT
jgi:hypothetical protein